MLNMIRLFWSPLIFYTTFPGVYWAFYPFLWGIFIQTHRFKYNFDMIINWVLTRQKLNQYGFLVKNKLHLDIFRLKP